MPLRCGIDLGTTYSCISWYDEYNNAVVTIDLDSADGDRILRSAVYYPGDGNLPVAGQTAWNMAKSHPDRVLWAMKRSIGTDYKSAPIDGEQYTPEQVSAEILKTLVRDAETFLGEEVEEVVITVPAYFGDAERTATEEAGRLAGLNVLGLLPEPHAAALAFAVDRAADIVDRKILVYDLGGGTFDITLIHARTDETAGNALNLDIQTLAKEGNRELGGLDWDRQLAEIVGDKIKDEHGTDVWDDPKSEVALLDNCERAKRSLTRTSSVSVVGDLANHQVEISDSEFEDRTRDLLLQTEMLVTQVLEEAADQFQCSIDEAKQQIDAMLTGGSSRMPMVKKLLEKLMGKPPLEHRNPELLVTRGAAYWAHLLQPDATIEIPVPNPDGKPETKTITRGAGLIIVDTSPYSVGVKAVRDRNGELESYNAVVLKKGAKYGESFSQVFETFEDGMIEIEIALYKGDSEVLDEHNLLKTFTISGLPPDRPAGQPIEVTLSYDNDGILRGKALDVNTNSEVKIEVKRGD